MIPINVSPGTREQFVQNIIAAWQSATPEQQHDGRVWYRTAHELAAMMTDGNPRAGAGVIAALSANKSWPENVRLARQACEAGLTSGHFTDALHKTAQIMAGADPEDVLPMERKTGQFFRLIANPGDPDAVVIDRHAHDVAVGETYGQRDRGLSSAGRYALLAHCFREAALRLGELPSTVQAVTWVAHTERIAGTSTRGPRRTT
ncbi:hypothetical protein ACFFS2_30700 [Streptomyces aurantiacus]|uniref:Uncharacterized protein n=1 Tax=Streptomyces aurantiacus TaxID=47760 RepID=A0A7G1P3W3_9ACTN|nr:hypothetical protein [Streptomyces aurantiacus]BCL28524.1 hypothetical protein GCM10017557_33830 [Streptomyces aurantiacus]